MLNTEQLATVRKAAAQMNVEAEKLLAFIEVEANGQVFANVGGKERPLIRFEGHYFYDRLKGKKLEEAVAKGLASPKVGGVKNAKDQVGRYAMLARAKAIDIIAAIESTSYGIGQVMGAHWKSFGMNSAMEFEQMANSGFEGQLQLMCLFLDRNGILPHLRRGDWSAVARIYNGPAYKKNNYDVKMKQAYEALTGDFNAKPSSSGMLRQGSKGANVRELQKLLVRLGYSLNVDGDFGPSTERAVKAFQQRAKLEVDGVVGQKTMQELRVAGGSMPVAKDSPLKDHNVRNGLIGAAVGTGTVEAAKNQVDAALSQVQSLAGSAITDYIIGSLSVLSAALAVGGLAYAGYGWLQSRRSYDGIEAAT